MTEREAGRVLDAHNFAHDRGQPFQRDETWLSFFDGIAELIARDLSLLLRMQR